MQKAVFLTLFATLVAAPLATARGAASKSCVLPLLALESTGSNSDLPSQVGEVFRRLLVESGEGVVNFEALKSVMAVDPLVVPLHDSSGAAILKAAFEGLRAFVETQEPALRMKIDQAVREEIKKIVEAHDVKQAEQREAKAERQLLPVAIETLPIPMGAGVETLVPDISNGDYRLLLALESKPQLVALDLTNVTVYDHGTQIFSKDPSWMGIDQGWLYWLEEGKAVKRTELVNPGGKTEILYNYLKRDCPMALDPVKHRLAGIFWEDGLPAGLRAAEIARLKNENASVMVKDLNGRESLKEIKLPGEFRIDKYSWLGFVPGTDKLVILIPHHGAFMTDVSKPDGGVWKTSQWVPSNNGILRLTSSIAPNGKFAVVGDYFVPMKRIDLTSSHPATAAVTEFEDSFDGNFYIWAASVSPDSKFVVGVTTRGDVKLWDSATGKLLQKVKVPAQPFARHVKFLPDGTLVVFDEKGKIYRVNFMQLLNEGGAG